MIALVEREKEQQLLLELCEKTAFGCKIASIVRAYGFEKGFACFWMDAQASVVFCSADDLMILSGTVTNAEETREFLRAVGPSSVMCAVKNAEALSLPVTDSGDVLKKRLEPGEAKPYDPYSVNVRELYGVLEDVGMAEEFESFYLDLSHKLRHGASLALTERREGETVGCAVVSSISRESAILSALAVREPFRRQGVGSELVRRIEACFPGKTMYVFREKDKHAEFYRELGYIKTDTWVYSRLRGKE